MKKRPFLPLVGFFVTLAIHTLYTIFENDKLVERWAPAGGANYLNLYFSQGEYLIGASYGLAIAFSIYVLARFVRNRNKGIAGLLGGMTLTGVLYVGGCFLLGCCGSPMLAVYMTLFGSTFLGFTKLLTFALTLASVVVGYIWLERKPLSVKDGTGEITCDCGGDEKCKPR